MNNFFNGMFGKVKNGMCRISMDGKIAISTSNGYKTYDVTTGSLINCDDFAFDIGQDFFFIIPTNKVQKGDIILAGGKPCCVIEEMSNSLKVLRYEDGAIQEVAIEKHFFMGKQYFYGKIVSMFGNLAKDGNMNNMMKYMMWSEMFKGNSNGFANNNSILPMVMFMNSGLGTMFDGLFDFNDTSKDENPEKEG